MGLSPSHGATPAGAFLSISFGASSTERKAEALRPAPKVIYKALRKAVIMVKDIGGKQFGRLTAIKYIGKSKSGKDEWECKCECGETITRSLDNLLYCGTKQCPKCRYKNRRNHFETHGLSNTRLYTIWCGMKARCYKQSADSYGRYGKRGIVICEEWKNDFLTFYTWAVANGYGDTLEIDRIDVNGNYEPSNCRWVTRKIQANNTRTNHFVVVAGERMTIAQAAEKLGINYAKAWSLFGTRGCGIARAQ